MGHSRRMLVFISYMLKILLVEGKAHCNRSKGEIWLVLVHALCVFPVAFKVVAPVILYRLPLDILGATSEAGTTYPFEQPEFTLIFLVGLIFTRSLVWCVMFCRSLFVFLSIFFCHFVFCDLHILVVPLVSSNSSCICLNYLPLDVKKPAINQSINQRRW